MIQSGRSGRSTRDAHAFRSMQPMLTIHRSASSSFDERVVDHPHLAVRLEAGNGARGIQSGMWPGASFWKKCLPCQPSG